MWLLQVLVNSASHGSEGIGKRIGLTSGRLELTGFAPFSGLVLVCPTWYLACACAVSCLSGPDHGK